VTSCATDLTSREKVSDAVVETAAAKSAWVMIQTQCVLGNLVVSSCFIVVLLWEIGITLSWLGLTTIPSPVITEFGMLEEKC
jgi:hypothetical protein